MRTQFIAAYSLKESFTTIYALEFQNSTCFGFADGTTSNGTSGWGFYRIGDKWEREEIDAHDMHHLMRWIPCPTETGFYKSCGSTKKHPNFLCKQCIRY